MSRGWTGSEMAATAEALLCPDCGTSFQGVDSATCSAGHKPVKLDWWAVCECGDHPHYDMTTFCLREGCGCEQYRESESRRQITRRTI